MVWRMMPLPHKAPMDINPMLEPTSPKNASILSVAPITPDKAGPLGDKLQRGKSLQKSPSIRGQLNFDLFSKTTLALTTASATASSSSARPESIQEALMLLEIDHQARQNEKYKYYLEPPTKPEVLKKRNLQRQQALEILSKMNGFHSLSPSLREKTKQLSQDCLENLLSPQYFEPPKNIAAIVNFYMNAHSGLTYSDLADTLAYVETCYQEDLNDYADYRELKRSIKAHSTEKPIR